MNLMPNESKRIGDMTPDEQREIVQYAAGRLQKELASLDVDKKSCVREIATAADVTEEILEVAEDICTGWYAEGRIDWEDFIDRLDGAELKDGTTIDLGNFMYSAAIEKLKRHIRQYQREISS